MTKGSLPFKLLGLTGGIASGKSTVARQLRARGLTVIDADRVSREIVEVGSPGLGEIVASFGARILNDDGTLNRPRLGAIVFADEAQRLRLNAITHPRIADRVAEHVQAAREAGSPLAVYESPLLVEGGLHVGLDLLIVVSCAPEVQLTRVMARDGLDAAAQARIDAQLPLAAKIAVADVVIDNSTTSQEAERAVEALLDGLAARLWPEHPEAGQAALDALRQETE